MDDDERMTALLDRLEHLLDFFEKARPTLERLLANPLLKIGRR